MTAGASPAVVTPGPGKGEATGARVRSRRRWLPGAGGFLVAAALVAAMTLGAIYQPVSYGMAAPAVQGPVRIRVVNDFGDMRGQIYIPPQPAGDGALIVGLANTGAYPVTIESVSMPQYPNALNQQTGPATYVSLGRNWPQPRGWPLPTGSSPIIGRATVPPGENILIRIPFRTPMCWTGGWSVVSSFWVTTKFLWWTHTFEVSWTSPQDPSGGAIMSELPDPNGGPGALCPHPR
jgi:hypothetical protein